MKTIFLLLFTPLFAFAQSGIIGKWTNKDFGFDMNLELKTDGSGSFDGEPINYTSSATAISFIEAGEITTYQYTLNGNVLRLSGGDLDAPISFQRNGTSSVVVAPKPQATASNNGVDRNLVGTWLGNGEKISFQGDGVCIYNAIPMTYSTDGSTLVITGSTGPAYLGYTIRGNTLTLSGNGTTAVLDREGSTPTVSDSPAPSLPSAPAGQLQGTIDQSIVGKWCWSNTSSSSYNASSSSSRCIIINGNGTYEYYAEGSISGYNSGSYGGSASQSSDNGTWRLKGNQLYVQSQQEGFKIYTFEKRNHPKNNDPMIVIDGDTYVTFYNKAPW